MKIVIVGPGAMGCLIAAFLSKAKQDVSILDKNKARADYINKNGIKVEGISGNWKAAVSATNDINEAKSADVVIICTKSYDTKEAAKSIAGVIKEDNLVLTLQNGVGNVEIIAEEVGEERVIGGVSNLGATLLGDGHVRHAGKGETAIGMVGGKTPVLMRDIRETFNKAGLEMRISKDIDSLIWSKLIINVGINALTAITHLNNGRLIEFEGTREILKDAVTEAVKVAKRKRIKLIYDDPLSKVESVCEATATNVSSMLQDVLRQKRTEIDFINGVIVRQGKSIGIATPVNEILVNLVKTIEQSYKVRVG